MGHGNDRSTEVMAVAAVFMAVASVTVILRCYVRLLIVKAFGWDDAVMVIAMVDSMRTRPQKPKLMKLRSYSMRCSPDV